MLNAQIGDTNSLYAWGSGTSGATVWVTGALAHMLEHRPDLAQWILWRRKTDRRRCR